MTVSCRVPTPAVADKLTLLHVACWREAYRGIVPDTVLDCIDIADRTGKYVSADPVVVPAELVIRGSTAAPARHRL